MQPGDSTELQMSPEQVCTPADRVDRKALADISEPGIGNLVIWHDWCKSDARLDGDLAASYVAQSWGSCHAQSLRGAPCYTASPGEVTRDLQRCSELHVAAAQLTNSEWPAELASSPKLLLS